jgi:hypothetical protein
MANFQGIVIIVAILLLIIALILIGLLMAKSKSTEQWPPLIGACPDYWMDTSGNGSNCVNVKDLGTPKCNYAPLSPDNGDHLTMDFSVAPYDGSNGLCQKYTWATGCGVSWDGITYGVQNPCTTPPPSS